MRLNVILYSLAILFFFSSCQKKQKPKDERVNSFNELAGMFADPPAEYRTVPFWVWNDKVTKEKIDRQLADYKDKGFGGVFIHPRYGMITEYLSDEWFELVKYSVEKGKELGLYIWLYDENSYPSGFAGGHVPAEMPESYNEGIALMQHKMNKLEPDTGLVYIHIFLKQDGKLVEITGEKEKYLGQEGDFYLYELIWFPKGKWFAGYSYVDLIHKGVTEKFIDVTMKGYEQSIGTEFGKVVPGIFTDEPNIGHRGGRDMFRWTPDLYQVFKYRWGYDLREHLNAIVEEEGDWKKIRHDYYEVLLQMFIDRWSKPWYKYTEENNLKWTGHYWEHGWPNPYHGGDNMAMYAWHQVPAIDMLFNTWGDRPDQFGNVRSVKELASVANQFGKIRTLSETYGGSGHELTFEDMKRNGDWEYVLGVNMMNQHLSFMTIMGDRKHDYPQTFSHHSPWWDYYHYQNDYFGRLSLALSSGEQVNHILIIEPTTTAWMYYNPGGENNKLDEIEKVFRNFIDKLEMYQIEYDLGCENIMKDHANARDGQIIIKNRKYDMLVFPPGLENLESSSVNLVTDYLSQGGDILSFVPPPGYVDGAESERMNELRLQYADQCYALSPELTQAEVELLAPVGIRFINPENTGGSLYHMRRKLEEGELIYLVNSNPEENSAGSFEMTGQSVTQLDLEKGAMCSYPFKVSGDKLNISFNLPPCGSLLLFAGSKVADLENCIDGSGSWKIVESSGPLTITPAGENLLALDYCSLTMGDIKGEEQYFYSASDKIFKHHGFDDNPWSSSIQFKTEILDRDTFEKDKSGFRVDYQFIMVHEVDYTTFEAVVERPYLYSVLVNNNEVHPEKGAWWLDESFGVFSIGEHLRPGENTITLIANPMSVYCELAPILIKGNFSLKSGKKGWVVFPAGKLNTGSWKAQGYPFYYDAVSYSKIFRADDPDTPYKIRLGDWSGTVAVVEVNGEEAGIIFHKPYELNITGKVKQGENVVVVKVVGSLKNLLGPHHNINIRGLVSPWSFKYAPEIQPSGDEYDLLDYGLMEDFSIISTISP